MKVMNDKQKLLEAFLKNPEIDISEHDLEDMLDAELTKPEDQMDMGLIDEILACLEPREVSEAEIMKGLEKLKAAFRERKTNE